MAFNITPVTNHREREKGVIVYPVYSRRSEGLSIGINLFPGEKSCQFDCPYCEVFPFSSNAEFSLDQMETDLRAAIDNAKKQNIPIKDICFSGNGEPTLSPIFSGAFKIAENIRAELATNSQLVVISNGTGILQPQIFSLLKEACTNPAVNIWLKLDAGTPAWYKKINRCQIPYEKLIKNIKEFVSCAPVTIQTMLCAINDNPPPQEEIKAWETLMCELAVNAKNNKGGNIRKIQLYGKARAAPEDPLASELPANYLQERAASLGKTLTEKNIAIPVEVYL